MMGYRTPNIDRVANEGAIFTDYYGQQSCTAGRAAFITGQSPLRTGLLKVGLPAAKEGLSEKDPTIAELLKPQGYVTGQFGKTISATATNSCRPFMASINSSAISTN
jgi:arylsulfatase A-like enzyme